MGRLCAVESGGGDTRIRDFFKKILNSIIATPLEADMRAARIRDTH